MESDLRGHIALVTGASRGIGAAIATSLAQAGAAVAVNYRERADKADALAGQLNVTPQIAFHCHLRCWQSACERLLEMIAADVADGLVRLRGAGFFRHRSEEHTS